MEIESLRLQLKERVNQYWTSQCITIHCIMQEGEVKELLMAATALQYQLKTVRPILYTDSDDNKYFVDY